MTNASQLRRRHRPPAGIRHARSGRAQVDVRVDPGVWKVAMDLAAGDPRRVTIVSATEVVVR